MQRTPREGLCGDCNTGSRVGSLTAGPSQLGPTAIHKEHCGPTQPPMVLEGVGEAEEDHCLG